MLFTYFKVSEVISAAKYYELALRSDDVKDALKTMRKIEGFRPPLSTPW
jgi:hypothetical protein